MTRIEIERFLTTKAHTFTNVSFTNQKTITLKKVINKLQFIQYFEISVVKESNSCSRIFYPHEFDSIDQFIFLVEKGICWADAEIIKLQKIKAEKEKQLNLFF